MPVKDRIINVCLCCDNNYAQHMGVTLASILANKNQEDLINICILDGGISYQNKEKIKQLCNIADFGVEFLSVNKEKFSQCPIQDWTHLSLTAYYILLLPALKQGWDKIIYLDCDTVVKTSLRDLFNTELSDNYIAAITDISEEKHKNRLELEHYINSGVIIFNAKKWREDDVSSKIFSWIEKNGNKIVLHDQDILNAVLNDKILILDNKWNAQIIRDFDKEKAKEWECANILHFIHKKKPWLSYNGDKFTTEYIKYLKLTPWKNFLFKYYLFIVPVSIFKKVLTFIFEIKNQRNTNKKIITILGFKFTKIRKSAAQA